jgi:hypothetical protein
MSAVFHCCDPRRLQVIKTSGSANAIEFIEVLDKDAPLAAPRQQTLFARLLRSGFTLTPDNLRITVGERIRHVGIVWCAPANALPLQAEAGLVDTVDDLAHTLVIRTDSSGDHAGYQLHLVANSGSDQAPAGYDPRLSTIAFSFKVECPSDFDCAPTCDCPEVPPAQPDIEYLARDYQGLRRLMLDRLSLLTPGWTERSAADLGVTLVETLAYAADNLSYRQDAIANEAYLATARQRISVRRHARLVDYHLHEGCNARTFVHLDVVGTGLNLPPGTLLLTRTPGLPTVVVPDSFALHEAIAGGALVFETGHAATLNEGLNTLHFYTWGDEACCLPRGATQATLRGLAPGLQPGDILLFEERVNPVTFRAEDAAHDHRWAVRLTDLQRTDDPSGQLFDEPPVDGPLDVTTITWNAADALPFALCLSAAERPGLAISVALGNNVLADHGLTVTGEDLGVVPAPRVTAMAQAAGSSCCDDPPPVLRPSRYRPTLAQAPLAQGFDLASLLAVPIGPDTAWWPASSLRSIDARTASPRITSLQSQLGSVSDSWTAQRDLLASGVEAADYTVEVGDDARARLRFGDGTSGKRPEVGTRFTAAYRVGNGVIGNVGAEAIAHIVSTVNGRYTAVRNPLAAAGGVEPEDIEAARRDAPQAFRTQERAVTAADYAAAAERRPDVQRAAASFRWTGSWYTVFTTADRYGGLDVDAPFKARLRQHLERFRMAGVDLDVNAPRYAPLDITLHICVKPGYFRADVLRAVGLVLSSGVRPDGRLGLFHPDNFSFGQAVYLSPIVAAAQAVDGVDAVRPERFERLGASGSTTLADGVIPIGDFEIAQLANSPDFGERGRFTLTSGGGK